MVSQDHFIGYVTTTLNNTFANNFETNGAPYVLACLLPVLIVNLSILNHLNNKILVNSWLRNIFCFTNAPYTY